MSENLKAFLSKVSADGKLIERLKEAKEYDEILALAKEIGVELTLADIEPENAEMSENDVMSSRPELDDKELEAVVGGERICSCAFGGGGKAEGELPACACVIAGFGKDDGDGLTCICPVGGYGGWWTLGTQ